MPRKSSKKTKDINFTKSSLMAFLQEIYNETVEQRNTAIRIQNKMLSFMKGPEDLTMIGPIIKEQQKIIDSVIDKKLSLAKIQQSVIQKAAETDANIEATLTDEDKDALKDFLLNMGEGGDEGNYEM